MAAKRKRPTRKEQQDQAQEQARARDVFASLPKLSATMLEFARPLLQTLPEPPAIDVLRSTLILVTGLWNLPLYERDGRPEAALHRATLDRAIAILPADVQRIVSDMLYARLTRFAKDPRLGFLEVRELANGEASVVATGALPGRR